MPLKLFTRTLRIPHSDKVIQKMGNAARPIWTAYFRPAKIPVVTLAILLLMASFVFATSHEAKQQSTDAMQDQSSSTTSATVVTVDKESGTFTILSQDGKPLEPQASELDFIHLVYEVLSINT
jgi:hypothetical protein